VTSHRTLILAPFLLLLLSGCGKSADSVAPTAAANAEESNVSAELALHPELVEDDLAESRDQTAVESATGSGGADIAAAIDPLFFWRDIRHVERAHEFSFRDTDSTGSPTTVVVTIHKRLAGTFNVVARQDVPEGTPQEGRLVQKPLRDHWVRRILLRRIETADARRRWRIAATSGVEVTSRAAETRVVSLRIQSGTLDTTVTDPLALFRLRQVLRFQPDAQVVLTATTLRNDDVVVFYRHGARSRFQNNGDNTYSATWTVAALTGVRHLGVNALSHGTLFDDVAPYDSQAWILPYVIVPTELADLAL